MLPFTRGARPARLPDEVRKVANINFPKYADLVAHKFPDDLAINIVGVKIDFDAPAAPKVSDVEPLDNDSRSGGEQRDNGKPPAHSPRNDRDRTFIQSLN